MMQLKPVLTGAGQYPNPISQAGIAAVDVRDIADAALVSEDFVRETAAEWSK